MLLILLGCLPASQAIEGYPFRVVTENFGHFHRIQAINEGATPIAAKVEVTTEGNAVTDRLWPANVTVPAGQSFTMGRVFRARDNGHGYSVRTSTFFRIGDFNVSHAPDVVYRLTFSDGLIFQVAQAFGGLITSDTATAPDEGQLADKLLTESGSRSNGGI